MQKHFILTLLLGLLAFGLPTLANKPPMITLNGHVKAKGEPLPFASVQIKSTSIGTASDAHGDYKLEVPEGTHQLRISSLGGIKRKAREAIPDSTFPAKRRC